MNRIEIQLLSRGVVSRRRALNSPLRQGSAELVQYYADFTPWGASTSYPMTAPVLKVLDQDGTDVTYGGHVSVVTAAPVDGGTGYSVDDILTLTEAGSSGDATVTVLTVSAGVILTVELTDVGYNYTTGTKATTGGNNDATIAITTVTDAELVVKASVSVVNSIELQFNLTNVVAGDRFRVFMKGTVNSLVEEAWIYIDGEL